MIQQFNVKYFYAGLFHKFRTKILLTGVMLLLSGCASTVAIFHKGSIKQEPGTVSLGTTIDDNTLETIAEVNISKASPSLHDSHISVVVYNKNLLLLGQVSSEQDKAMAENVVRELKGIKNIYNELEIAPNTSTLVRTSDALLTSKVKAKMVATSGFPSRKIKIVTEDSIVYLMGMISKSTGKEAISIAKDTSGVQKIVILFEYLD